MEVLSTVNQQINGGMNGEAKCAVRVRASRMENVVSGLAMLRASRSDRIDGRALRHLSTVGVNVSLFEYYNEVPAGHCRGGARFPGGSNRLVRLKVVGALRTGGNLF